jgi:hypothetical protein
LRQDVQNPAQCRRIDTVVDDHTRPAQQHTISIRPGDDEDSEVSATTAGSGNDTGLLAEDAPLTIAGANAVVSSVAISPPSRANRRHVNNWLADSPFRRAVTDTSRGPL